LLAWFSSLFCFYDTGYNLVHMPKPQAAPTGPTLIPQEAPPHIFTGKPVAQPHYHNHNTRNRQSRANHVTTVKPGRQALLQPQNITKRVREDYYIVHNHQTDEVVLLPKVNHVICPDTGKVQEYRALRQGKD
jgi:hypothetical protein